MPAIEITLNLLLLCGILICAFFAGFLLRGAQLRNCRKKIFELEKEMLSNHADILELQKQKAILLKQMKESEIPVIPMKPSKEEGDKLDQKSRHAK